ncbi:MAG: peptide ABC transporter permease [Candidatus Nephthysia bennettiae]|uniref:ABC transporter permease n=1 Tax=Candidatus Nephthysia bennettiae TaxID=3127016 RepID=A0A934NA55_9BACT|nr:ABC transporter permease [Candidatus Dormibacteraeota bacterium]MBJ7612639.1 ABC transporter permease [Candidatus Dormibacteraeota bacterium]PZR97418.1 MAG: peptide ABC transporter permease [Candidatus Dormibacteraeota bacterium]
MSRRRLPPSLLAGAVLVGLVVAAAAVSLVWTPHDPAHVVVPDRFLPPGHPGYPLGTDALGRDELSLLMAGARNTLLVGIVTVVIAMVLGVPAGGLAALRRGPLEEVAMRSSDLLLAFPALLLALLFAAVFRPSTLTAMAAIGIAFVPIFARVVRGAGLQVMEQDYITAARTFGSGGVWIFWRHLLPNVSSVVVVQAALAFAIAILAEAALSYLGLGTPPPTPSWGRMLSDSQSYLDQAPLLALWPGLSIAVAVLGFNLLGDGLRDLLDPRVVERLPQAQG